MQLSSNPNFRLFAIACGLIFFCCLPIWCVEFYINQDGVPHLYNAFLINEILNGNDTVSGFVSINHSLIPNLTGHWILALLLKIFSPQITFKLFVTLLFAVSALSALWLRVQIVGTQNVVTAMLLSFVLAFNWMWFLGFYNFILGASGVAFTLGLWWRWRENLSFTRILIIILLVVFVFFSHLISFAILCGLLGLLSLSQWKHENFKRTFVGTFLALIFTAPLLVNYLIISRSNAQASPSWGYLQNPFSISDWFLHLRSADPFQLMSRKAIPFTETVNSLFGLLSPCLWIISAIILLLIATYLSFKYISSEEKKSVLIWSFISGSLFLLWIFAPNDFGKSHGGLLRERILYIGLICFLPVFRIFENKILERTAQFFLCFVIFFQTMVVWDYARFADQIAKEILPVENLIEDNQSIGSIVINRDGCKFKPIPRVNLTTLITINKNNKVWDNYEIGYYLFPVIPNNDLDRQFIYEFRESNTFDFCDPQEQFESKLKRLSELMPVVQKKMDILIVLGSDERIDKLITEWFDELPFYQNGDVRLYRARKDK